MASQKSTAAQAGSATSPHDGEAGNPGYSPTTREDINRWIDANANIICEAAQNEGDCDSRVDYYRRKAAALIEEHSARLPTGSPSTPAARE